MNNFFHLTRDRSLIQEHLGKNWLGLQSSFSLNYSYHDFDIKCIPTKHNLYFISSNFSSQNEKERLMKKLESNFKSVILGFSIKMRLIGVGYRIETIDENTLKLKLGLSHDIFVPLKKGLQFKRFHDRSSIYIFTFDDLQKLKNFTNKLKQYRPVEPYKGKGFRYVNEYLKRKEGKKTNL